MMGKTRTIKDLLCILALFGLTAAVFRMWFGLGATTDLSDAMPWGLWKILNMVAGVALSTSGFTIGFLVYVLKLERFRPLVKPAILVAFLGYGSSCLALLFDIGIPYRFWHPFFMWNEHSFLFEVFWCVMLYFTVTFIEILPTILHRYGAARIRRALHRVTFGVVVVGISLSSLHHSSLGSLFLVTPLRLHGLWYSSWLPLFFILSAMGAGLMFVVLVRILYAHWYDPEPVFGPRGNETDASLCALPTRPPSPKRIERETEGMPPLRGVSIIAAMVLGLYLVLKLVDLGRAATWEGLLAGTWESWLYIAELLMATVIPILLVALPRVRRSPMGLAIAASFASAGLIMNRLDVGIFGYWHDARIGYFPSLIEWAVSLGVIAAAGLAFLVAVENFDIFGGARSGRGGVTKPFLASFDSFSRVWTVVLNSRLQRVSLLAVFILPLAWVSMYPGFHDWGTPAQATQPPVGLDDARATLRIDGNRRGVFTDFKHADHQDRLGGDSSCVNCHHVSAPSDRSTPCSRCHRDMLRPTRIFDHFHHMQAVAAAEKLPGRHPANHSCDECHTGKAVRSSAATRNCLECHRENMWLAGSPPDSAVGLACASSYQRAMHGTCIECHEREQLKPEKAGLADCGTCHPSLRTVEEVRADHFTFREPPVSTDLAARGLPLLHPQ